MRQLGIACKVCTWFDDDNPDECYCNYYPEPVITLPLRYCSYFRCVCGGDLDDMMDHSNCLEIEFDIE